MENNEFYLSVLEGGSGARWLWIDLCAPHDARFEISAMTGDASLEQKIK